MRSDAQGTFAWVVTNGRLRRQALRADGDRGDEVVVEQGLAGGEALVVSDAAALSEGEHVEVREAGR